MVAGKMLHSGHSSDAHALAREHNPVRLGRACPAVRPGAIAQIKARTALLIVEGAIHSYGARLWIELQHKQAVFPVAGDGNSVSLRVIAAPVREHQAIDHRPRDLNRVLRIGNINDHYCMAETHSLDQIVRNNVRHAAERAWELVDELCVCTVSESHAQIGSACRLAITPQIVDSWVEQLGLDRGDYGTHTLRRTKATLIYRRTKNLRAVQLLLGHSKLESTVRYLGSVNDALEMAEQTEV